MVQSGRPRQPGSNCSCLSRLGKKWQNSKYFCLRDTPLKGHQRWRRYDDQQNVIVLFKVIAFKLHSRWYFLFIFTVYIGPETVPEYPNKSDVHRT